MNTLKVYGFPRSGSHYLMALLAKNYYKNADLSTGPGGVGHWADRVQVVGSEHGKLAGHHGPPSWGYAPDKSIYIWRNGRAVAASVFRSPHFINPARKYLDFEEFIQYTIDWRWSPGNSSPGTTKTIIEHWVEHLQLWRKTKAFLVNYEDAVQHPRALLCRIANQFDLPIVLGEDCKEDVGWFPSGGRLDGWREIWTDECEDYYSEVVPVGFYGWTFRGT